MGIGNWWPYHSDDEVEAVAAVLRSGRTNYWSVNSHGQAFEQEFAKFHGPGVQALAVTNGTAALELALHALGIAPEQGWSGQLAEVIVPCRTFMATASAVVNSGYQPVLADIDAETLNVTVDTLEARRTEYTRAVIVVHWAGLPCDMPAICAWAKKHGILVIEDCAHAHGATLQGHHELPVGIWGAIGCYSFCVGKIMSTGGEGGMVVTRDAAMHKRMAAYRDHGRYQMMGSKDMTAFEWTVEEFGSNLRMTEMQSAIGRIQLRKLKGWVERRRDIAEFYDYLLGQKVRRPGHSFYLYLAQIDNRDEVLERLLSKDIPARIGGCPNIGREAVFKGRAALCPVADEVGKHILSLPIYPTMTDAEVRHVAEAVKNELVRA